MINSGTTQAASTVKLLSPVSAAATANATSSWTDIRAAEGDLVVIVETGALTGSLVWTVEHATDSGGTGAVAITPSDGAFTAGAANQTQKRSVSANAVGGWVRVVGTIVTGPVLVAASVSYQPKYS